MQPFVVFKMQFNVLFLLILFVKSAYSESTYDQSQNGELNVQVDLKHVNIIAILKGDKEDYMDYDYAYDYSEMTIKPLIGVAGKPTTTTAKPITSNASVISPIDLGSNNSQSNKTNSPSTTIQPQSNETGSPITTIILQSNGTSATTSTNPLTAIPKLNHTYSSTSTAAIQRETSTRSIRPQSLVAGTSTLNVVPIVTSTDSSIPEQLGNSSSRCRKGFVLNQKGDCELKIQESDNNALLKLVKLSQKLKLRRENKKN